MLYTNGIHGNAKEYIGKDGKIKWGLQTKQDGDREFFGSIDELVTSMIMRHGDTFILEITMFNRLNIGEI